MIDYYKNVHFGSEITEKLGEQVNIDLLEDQSNMPDGEFNL